MEFLKPTKTKIFMLVGMFLLMYLFAVLPGFLTAGGRIDYGFPFVFHSCSSSLGWDCPEIKLIALAADIICYYLISCTVVKVFSKNKNV